MGRLRPASRLVVCTLAKRGSCVCMYIVLGDDLGGEESCVISLLDLRIEYRRIYAFLNLSLLFRRMLGSPETNEVVS